MARKADSCVLLKRHLPHEHPGDLHLQVWLRPFCFVFFLEYLALSPPFLVSSQCEPPVWPFIVLCSDFFPLLPTNYLLFSPLACCYT